ncbi:MAG: hypothetical protein ACK559_17570, partial [bacterium]
MHVRQHPQAAFDHGHAVRARHGGRAVDHELQLALRVGLARGLDGLDGLGAQIDPGVGGAGLVEAHLRGEHVVGAGDRAGGAHDLEGAAAAQQRGDGGVVIGQAGQRGLQHEGAVLELQHR